MQLRGGGRNAFGRLSGYVPLLDGETALYREVREAVPVVDAAIGKLVRLTGGFSLDTGNDGLNAQLNRALSGINVGGNQQGIEAFIATYLDQLLTYGSAVGEMITDGRELYALYNGDTRNLEVRRAGNGLDLCFFSGGEPLLQPDAADFLRKVRDMGFSVKLDTNGCFPDRLAGILEERGFPQPCGSSPCL